MIYTLISDLNKNKSDDLLEKNFSIPTGKCASGEGISTKSQNNNENDKRDCRALRQPLSLLPPETDELIQNTKNPLSREERRLAYTTLISGINLFFGISDVKIRKNEDGKPYLLINEGCGNNSSGKYQKNEDLPTDTDPHQKNKDFSIEANENNASDTKRLGLWISISHSDGVIAVSISDEGEVGVDIQSEISPDKAKRLDQRFLFSVDARSESLDIRYYYCSISDNEAIFTEIPLSDAKILDFTAKWTYSEAILKLFGRGFGDIGKLRELSKAAKCEIREYKGKKVYYISTAARK